MSPSSETPDWVDETTLPPEHMLAITKIEQEINPVSWDVDFKIWTGVRGRVTKKMSGGMADVYIVRASHSDLTFAVKTLKADAFNSEWSLDGIIEEAERWVSLGKHTNIVQAFMVAYFRKKPAIWLEYVDGGDLYQHIGKLTIPAILDYAIQLCNGMDYAYTRTGIVHNDIKPSNILLSSDKKTLKVTDFGISYFAEGESDKPDLQVGSPQFRGGTTPYMAPEAFPLATQQKHSYCTPKMGVSMCSDIFSFGVTLYEILTGNRPFENEVKMEVFKQIPDSPASRRPDVPKELDLLVMRCLEKDPVKRYQSFGELKQVLIEIYDCLPKEQKLFGAEYTIGGDEEQDGGVALYTMGHMLATLRRYGEANSYLERYLVINPEYAEAWHIKGSCHGFLREWEQAKQCFGQAVAIRPKYALAWYNKGACHERLGEWQQAKQCYGQAVAIKPKYALAWYGKGKCHGQLGEWEQAKQCHGQAVAIKPKYALAWSSKGYCHGNLGEWQQAKQCYGQAVAIKPKYALAWCSKGLCHFSLKEYEEAKYCFEQTVDNEPAYAMAWYFKGICNVRLRDYGKAKDCFIEFVRIASPEMADSIKIAKDYIQQWSEPS